MGIKKFSYSLFVLALLLFASTLFAQEKSNQTETIDGVKYYMHYTEKGNTLYSLSKTYAVTIDDILKNNPEVKETGLKEGLILKIPFQGSGETNSDKKSESKPDPNKIKGDFIIHTAKAGETLYSISRIYQVSVQDILAHNNDAIDGLKIGDELKIPFKKMAPVMEERVNPEVEDSLKTHTVAKGETYYSISKMYDVPLSELKEVNKSYGESLKEGQIIRIPNKRKRKRDKEQTVEEKPEIIAPVVSTTVTPPAQEETIPFEAKKLEVYNIALMLPLYVEINDSIERYRKLDEESRIYPTSLLSINMYKGIMLAIDSLKKEGMSLNVYLYDTKNDSVLVEELLKKPEMKDMHLFIGPLYRAHLVRVAKFANQYQIPIVCPVPQSNKVLIENKTLCKVNPSYQIHITKMADYICGTYSDQNIMAFNKYGKEEKKLIQDFIQFGNERLRIVDAFRKDTIREIFFKEFTPSEIKSVLSLDKENVIVIQSTDQAYVTDILTKLNNIGDLYKITVFGHEKWLTYDNIEFEYFHKLNVHFSVGTFIDYNSTDIKGFMKNFRKKHFIDPDKYALAGFDIGYFYLNCLNKYGTGFLTELPKIKHKGLSLRFDFLKTGIESGYENQAITIFKYVDYQPTKVY